MKPFAGIRIVDFTQAHAGSLATMLLSDMGAEVIKIERKGAGDLARYWAPFSGDNSGYYAYLNRGKKSMSLNLTTPEGKEIVKKLIASADVVTENFKYGSMQRMGLSYDEVRAIKPDIIYASLNGYGQNGPMMKTIGLDLQLQSMSGVMDATGFPTGDPVRVGVAFGDHMSGTYMALAIALALLERRKSGKGQYIDIAILDSLFSLLREPLSKGNTGVVRRGNAATAAMPSDTFKTKDGYVLVQATEDAHWAASCNAMGCADAADAADRTAAMDTLRAAAANFTKKDLADALAKAGVPSVAVHTVDEATDSERSNGLLATVQDDALGTVDIPNSHFHIDSIDTNVTVAAPLQGAHTEFYLKEIGYSDADIAALYACGAAEGQEAKA